jgi:hypothetical protein
MFTKRLNDNVKNAALRKHSDKPLAMLSSKGPCPLDMVNHPDFNEAAMGDT